MEEFIKQKRRKEMRKPNLTIIENLRRFIVESSKSEKYIRSKQDFTRERKLTFNRVVTFIINLAKKSLSIELEFFFARINKNEGTETESCSKSAFSQARKKLKPEIFEDLNKELLKEYYSDNDDRVKRWNGYRLIGEDGSTMYLLDRKDVREEFGVHRNENLERVMARVMCSYDVLNNLSIQSRIMPISRDELSIATEWVEGHDEDMLTLYDRGFRGFALIYIHLIKQSEFVMRTTKTFNNEITVFVKSNKRSAIVEMPCTKKSRRKLKLLGYDVDRKVTVKVRLIRVNLDSGEEEILITSLLDSKKYPTRIFKDLYYKRWGVETYYDRLKNKFQIEVFSGISAEAIKQDFYAMIFVSNLQSIIIDEGEEELKNINKNRKYEYQINWNVSLGLMKDEIIDLFISSNSEQILLRLKDKFLKYLEPIRPNRKFKRIIKSKRRKGKFQTFTNYKRAI